MTQNFKQSLNLSWMATGNNKEKLTATKPKEIILWNQVYPVGNWVNVYKQVIQELYKENKEIIHQIVLGQIDDEVLTANFLTTPIKSKKTGNERRTLQLADGVFVCINMNVQNFVSILSKLFDLYGFNKDDLQVNLKDDVDDEYEEDNDE